MSNSEDKPVEELRERLDRVESRMDRIEKLASSKGGGNLEDELDDLRISLNGLRREHRELKEEVEEKVLDYIEEEKAVLSEMDRKIETVGDLAREIKSNSEELREVEESMERKIDRKEFEDRLEETRKEGSSEDRALLDRVRKLETRMDLLTERLD